ncbi:hypothetical protein LCGC14_1686570 [marine sediment metagenome]|uniref:Uncharacterized protein n=1 Tax=marine sediment metagenome TaxID=412755 RepID=A0A0F9HM40_9ZZZZ
MKIELHKILESRKEILEGGGNPTDLVINPQEYKDSNLKQNLFGMDIIVDRDCEKGKVYLIDRTKIRIEPFSVPKKLSLIKRIIKRLRDIWFTIKYRVE